MYCSINTRDRRKKLRCPSENDKRWNCFLEPNVKVSHSAHCQLFAQLWKLLTKLGTDNTREETPTQLNKMFCNDTKSKERVLRSLSPGTLQSMPRWVFTTSCVSLLLEIGRLSNKLTQGQDLHTPLGRDESEAVHEDVPDY